MKKVRRFDYLGRREHIKRFLASENAEQALVDLYVRDSMSAPEISEKLASAGIHMSARSIQRILCFGGVIRPKGDAFRLAAKRGRIRWALKDPRFKVRGRKIRSATRYAVLERDGFKCVLCGNTAQNTILEVDYIVAVIHGGTDEMDNLRTLCHACNEGKRVAKKEA